MAHPDILVEEDFGMDIRWVTVNGRHLPFIFAARPVGAEPKCNFDGENAPPDHPRWLEFGESPNGYAEFKARETNHD